MRRSFFLKSVLIASLALGAAAFSAEAKEEKTMFELQQILGQKNFSAVKAGASASVMTGPNGLAFFNDSLIVSEYQNRRVLIFKNLKSSNFPAADVVIGQRDFKSTNERPGAAGFGGPGKLTVAGGMLFITDFTRNRILIYKSIPDQNEASADWVLGQENFSQSAPGLGRAHLNRPVDVTSDGQRLIVADYGNNRVLIYNELPTKNGAEADVVLGQPDFDHAEAGGGRNRFKIPQGIFTDGTRLYIADSGNNRVLVYNQIPTQNFSQADFVIGQTDFDQLGSGTSAAQFHEPDCVATDGKRLFVSDLKNHRVVIFKAIPQASGAAADEILGQADFSSNLPSSEEGRFNMPRQLIYKDHKLYVADRGNHRVLVFGQSQEINS